MKTKITAVAALRMAYLKNNTTTRNRASMGLPGNGSAGYLRAAYQLPQRAGTS
jgi:hypothetical protein